MNLTKEQMSEQMHNTLSFQPVAFYLFPSRIAVSSAIKPSISVVTIGITATQPFGILECGDIR